MRSYERILTIGCMACLVACGSDPAPEPAEATKAPVRAPRPELPADAPAPNQPPRIERIRFEPEEPAVGDTLRALVETSDRDGETVWLTYAWSVDGEALDVADDEIQLLPTRFERGDTLELSVEASDGKEQVRDSARVDVENAVPRLVTVEYVPAGAFASGAPITLRPDARDADGDEIEFRYEWRVNGRLVGEDGPVLETDRLKRGDTVQAKVVVADELGESEPFETPRLTIANSPPRVVSKPGAESSDGAFRYLVQAEDPDGDRDLRFHLENEPEGMTVDPRSGAIVWTPRADQAGDYQVSVVVDDLQGGKTKQVFEVNVGAPHETPPPAARSR